MYLNAAKDDLGVAIYAIRHNVAYDHIHIMMPKPHDCEFDAAPMGNKYCHYKPIYDLKGNDLYVVD
jgi:hypothetical protein